MPHEFDNFGNLVPPSEEQLAAADEETEIIVLDQGVLEDETPYWAYLSIKPSRYAEFIQKTSQQIPIDLEEYGEILNQGYEEEVPYWAIEEMQSQYQFDDNYIDQLTNRLMALQKTFMQQNELKRIYAIVAHMKKTQQQLAEKQQAVKGNATQSKIPQKTVAQHKNPKRK
jgi:hypothetical protein